ncbi:MAG: nitroreductase family protein [Synergistaceae bacterium]|nr:nitroreductase family protein [Synergistaceae bacterium]
MLELMSRRRSIRKFKNERVSEEAIKSLVDAALLAPSGKNAKPCEFFVVQDKVKIEKLAACKDGPTEALKSAPLAIVVTANPEKSDVWAVDAAIAASHILLEAEALGLGCCWIQIMNRRSGQLMADSQVKKLLNISTSLSVLCVMAIGIADECKEPHAIDSLSRANVHFL